MSPLLSVNLQDVSSDGPPKFEPGVYDLECTKTEVGRSDDGSKTWIDAKFMAANRDPDDARVVRNRFFLSEAAMFIFKRFLESAGSDMANSESIDTDALVGLICKAKVEAKSDVKDGEERTFINITQFLKP